MKRSLKQRATGFTLIEIMIVVAIIGILAAIAVPQYAEYVTRGRIPEATTALADARIRMEQFFQDNRAYPAGCVNTGTPTATQIKVADGQFFTLTCPTLTATTYVITATGVGPMAGFTYTVNESNVRASTFSTTLQAKGWANKPNCWSTSKGSC